MSRRAAFLDEGLGETRGVVLLDGRPERLIIERLGEPASQRLGARSVARIVAVERTLNLIFLSMPDGPDATAPLSAGQAAVQGSSWRVTVQAEPRSGKGAVISLDEETSGPPRLIDGGPTIAKRLEAWAGRPPLTGAQAREAADEAQDAALAAVQALPGGGSVSVERTRALTAIDVDVGARPGGDAARAQRSANLAAIAEGARLLRLKAIGGLVIFDLAGRGHNGPQLQAAARAAFAEDEPGVAIGPISRFGLFELALPWRRTPVAERLCGPDGRVSPRTVAHALLRALQREGAADPGARMVARCGKEVGEAAKAWVPELAARIGARFRLEVDPGLPAENFEVRSL